MARAARQRRPLFAEDAPLSQPNGTAIFERFLFFGRESCLWDSRSAIIKENTEAGDDMTRKERILDAKRCLDALALGLDPHTGGELPGDSVLNRVEISRCIFFVSGLLQEIYDNGPRAPALPFALPIEQRAAFPFTEQPMIVSEICRALNEMVDPFVYRYLRTTTITYLASAAASWR